MPSPRPLPLSALAFAVLLVAGGAAAGDEIAKCEARFVQSPQAEFACGCFYFLGLRGAAAGDDALVRLKAHLERDPDNGCLLFTLGRLESHLRRTGAAAHLEEAAAAYRAGGQPEGETYARLNLAGVHGAASRYDQAESELELASRAALASGKVYLPTEIAVRRAGFWLEQGKDLEKVESLLRQAEREAPPMLHDSLQRDLWLTLGDVQHQLGRRDEAEATYRRLIELTRKENPPGRTDLYGEAAARHSLALAYLSRPPSPANVKEMTTRLEEALAAAVAGHHPRVEADSRRWLGRLRGGPAGLAEIEKSLELAAAANDDFLVRMGLAAEAAAIVERDPRRAVVLIEQARGVAIEPELEIYGWLDRLKVGWASLPQDEAARVSLAELAAIEQLRGRQQDSLIRAEMFSVWADAYSWLAGRLLAEGDAVAAFPLLERRHARSLLDSAPAGSAFASLDEVRAALAADEAFVYFQQAFEKDVFGEFAGSSWLLVLTRDQEPRIYRTADPLEVDPLVPAFAGLLARGDEAAAAGVRLEEMLFGRALAELPPAVRRLVLLPDEDLQLLPFAALRATPDGPSLAERFQLSVVPSATLWRRWRAAGLAKAPAPRAVLAFADPAPGASPEAAAPLPGARREGRGAVRALGGGSELRLGEDAGEAALASADLAPFGLLHFAVHAIHGRAGLRSERSALVLAPGTGGADGLLQPREIRGLHLTGKSVVLAACRGAEGEVLAGEGALSLAHAFFAAGAEVVVASLWNLGDEAAARFGKRFYRHLGAGEKAGDAFAAAQREGIAAGEPAAAWAGLVLLGNSEWRLAPAPPARWPWLAIPATILLLALIALRRRLRRGRRQLLP